VSLGASESEEDAAKLYDDYARKVPGHHRLNFSTDAHSNAAADGHGGASEAGTEVRGFIESVSGVYMERQVGAYCALHALNALLGSARLGASPAMLLRVEGVLNALAISQVRGASRRMHALNTPRRSSRSVLRVQKKRRSALLSLSLSGLTLCLGPPRRCATAANQASWTSTRS
jgi:hypothetical protein